MAGRLEETLKSINSQYGTNLSSDSVKSSQAAKALKAVGAEPTGGTDGTTGQYVLPKRISDLKDNDYVSQFFSEYNSFLEDLDTRIRDVSYDAQKEIYTSNLSSIKDLLEKSDAISYIFSGMEDVPDELRNEVTKVSESLKQISKELQNTQNTVSKYDSEEAYNTAKQENAWFNKYSGKDSRELESLLGAVTDEGEKKWLDDYRKYVDYNERANLDTDAYSLAIKQLEEQYDFYKNAKQGDIKAAEGKTEMETLMDLLDETGAEIDKRKAYLQAAKLIQEKEAGKETYDAIRNNADFEQFSRYDPAKQEIGYQYINADANGRENLKQKYGQYAENFEENAYDSLSDEEKETYNYLMNIGNRQGAADYLKYLREDLGYRKAQELFEGYEDHKGLEYVFGLEAGLDQARSGMQGFGNLIAGREEYVPASYKQQLSGMIREDLGDGKVNLPGIMGGGTLGQAVYDTVTTSANMAPSIVASTAIGILNPAAGAAVGNALMGATAAGNAYTEAINAGFSKEDARGYGLLVGASEMVMEKVLGGITGLGGNAVSKNLVSNLNAADTAFKMVIKRIGGGMLSEFGEEYLQEVLTPVIKNLTLGTHEDVQVFSAEALYSGILGALTAFVMEGPSGVMEASGIKNTGKAVQEAGAAERLAELGRTFSADTVAYQLAGKVDANTDAFTLGRLFNEIGASMSEQNKTDITNALVAEGMDLEIARKNAEVLNYIVEGGEVSDIQMKMIQKNNILSKVMREVLIDENSTVNQRARGYTEATQTMSGRTAQPSEAQQPAGGQKQTKAAPTVAKKETVAKNSYDLSGNGKTTYIPDGKEVRIKEIASIKDGKMQLKLEDGRTVDSKDVGYANESEALVYESIAKMDVNAAVANTLVNAYNLDSSVGAEVYVKGVQEAYRYGQYGYPNTQGPFSSMLTEQQRNTAYKLGKMFSGQQVAKEQAMVRKPKGAAKGNAKGGVFFEGSDGSVTDWDSYKNKPGLKPTQETALQTMRMLSQVLDIKFYVGDYSSRTTKGVKSINGFYNTKDSSIHIDLNAGMDSQKTMLFTLGHELTHFIRHWSPSKFKVLANFLMEEFSQHNNMDAWVREKMDQTGLGYADAYEEVVADAMEAMLADGNVVQKLAKLKQQDKSLWQKIKDFIDNWAAKLKEAYEGLKPESAEGKAVLEMTDKLEEIQQLFAEGLVEASENYQASQKTEAEETEPVAMAASVKKYSAIDSKYQKRITLSMTDSEKTEILKNKVITAAVYEGQAKDSIESEKADLKSHEESLIKKALVRIGEEFGVFTDYSIADVNVDIRLSRGNLKESVQKEANPIQIAKMLPILRTAVENAVGIECHANRYFYDSNTVMFENMIGGFVEGNYFIPVRFGLKHSISGKATLYLIVDQEKIEINKIKAEVSKATVMHKHHADNTSRSAFNISLASIIPFVNSKDLLRYLPDNMLTRPQKDAKWEAIAETIVYTNNKNDEKYYKFIKSGNLIAAGQMVRQAAKSAGYDRMFFHGAKKGGGFTRFREWSYFTENKQYAERYAQRDNPGSLYTVYGKMENPFDTRDSKAKEIFDEIRNEYGLSELQDTGLPDWTDGYDITDYIDENDLDYDGVVLDEGGDMVDGKPVSRGLSYVIRNSEQVKSADVITYDDDGNIIPISKRFDSGNPDIRYQSKVDENFSNRSLLMRVDESSLENPIEVKRLREYKETVAKAEAEEQVLQELNKKIRTELDQKKVKGLRFEANKRINRLATLDKQILRKEAELNTVLEREQKMAYLQGEQKRADAYEKYRIETEVEHLKTMREYRATRAELHDLKDDTKVMEKEFVRVVKEYEKQAEASKKQTGKDAETITKLRQMLDAEAKKHKEESAVWQKEFNRLLKEYDAAGRNIGRLEAQVQKQRQSAKEKVTSRKKTEMRQKIRKVIRDLDKILNRGDKKRNVKEGLKDFVAEALSSAEILFTDYYSNEDMLRNGVGTDLTPEEAKLLKEAQGILAKISNLPTGYEGYLARQEQEQKLKGQLSRKMAGLKSVFIRERERLNKTKVSTVLGNLADAYGQLRDAEQAVVQGAYHEGVHEYLKMLQSDIGGTVIKDMTLDQLEELYKAYTMVMTTVRNANKMFAENLNATREALARDVMREVKTVGGERKLWWKFGDKLNRFSWNNEKPVYAFERIGSDTLKTLYGNIRKGQDTWAVDLQDANQFRQDIWKQYNYSKWDRDKQYKFTSSSGADFELNLEQIMSIYAYSKREQAHDHLLKGGFVFDDSTEVTVTKYKIPLKFLKKNATAYNLSLETLEEIISKLTPEQRNFVDKMQDYLSTTMGDKGNEISMELYGVKLFNEKFYFPLRSAGQYMERAKEADLKKEQGQVNLVNSGFSKATKVKASNPVVLDGFMNVWAGHVNEMSMYHAFVLPMEDFRRVYNYSTPHAEEQQSASVNSVIQNAYGKAATDYIDQLYRDLNGGALTDNRTGVINALMGLFKKGAVFASLSVTVQQPSAISRATALIDNKYFIGVRVDAKKHKETWAEVKRYAPVATIKEMGFFDTNMGRSATDFLTSQEYSGILEKAKALVTDEAYRDELLSKAPALADELTWCSIWEAVKRETKDKHKGMDVKSEAFLKLAGERFSEVIDKTQVYDSVLARSANMRSKDTGMKMATAFMAEPTTSINMVMDALRKGKRGDKKQARKAIGAVVSSVILNSFLVAWVYAARDDDEDETYREKYLSSFFSSIRDGLNPMTYIPFLKDIVSIIEGYDVERSDMAVISDLWNAYKQLESDDVSAWRKVEGFVGSICQIFGLPVKNIMRDVRSLYQVYNTKVNGEKNTTRGTAIAIVEGITGKKPTSGEQLYTARKKGDEEHAARVEARYAKDAKDEEKAKKSADAAVAQAIKDRYMDDKLTLAQATMELTQYAGKKPDEAYWYMDAYRYKKETKKDDYTKYKALYEAVATGVNLKAVIKTYTDNGVEKKDLSGAITEKFHKDYVEMSVSERAAIKGYLLNAYEQIGVNRWEAEEKIKGWDFEAKYNKTYSEMLSDYEDGTVSERDIRAAMKDYGLKEYEIAEKLDDIKEKNKFRDKFDVTYSEAVDMYMNDALSRSTMKSMLLFNGKTETEAEGTILEWDVAKKLGISYDKLDDAYKHGDITRTQLYNAMIATGTKKAKADEAIACYDWLKAKYKEYPDLTLTDAKRFVVKISDNDKEHTLADYGVSLKTYQNYVEKAKDCTGEDANGDGVIDSYSKAIQLFAMIDRLNISDSQKTALAYITNAKSTIRKYAPWY